MTPHALRAALGALAVSCLCASAAQATDAGTPTGELGTKHDVAADGNDPAQHDPLEGMNRAIFEVNGVLYEITSPLVEATPDPIRGLFKAVGAAVAAPVRIVTNIATGDHRNEHLADIAKDNDVDCGYFLVLPLAGPTTSRDAVGTGMEMAGGIAAGQIVYLGAGAAANDRIEADVQIRQLDGAVDAYALARSATLQDRGCIVAQQDDAPSAFGGDGTMTEEASTAR
jgi:ABC-type transporter lipoprotein component MlaA